MMLKTELCGQNNVDLTDFNNFVAERCAKALMENEEYMEMERGGKATPDELQVKAEELCYKQCLKDILAIILCSQKV